MILFDSHVHIYDCFNLDTFFEKAFCNFRKAAGNIDENSGHLTCFLLLTEAKGYDYFAQLRALAGGKTTPWKIFETAENNSLLVTHDRHSSMSVFVVAGRQLVTAERLELLALFVMNELQDGMEFEQAIVEVSRNGGIAVCPWGAGKWLGKRGNRLSQCFLQEDAESFFVGDSGGRPHFLPAPSIFKSAKKKNSHILSGTDPLPLFGEESRVGSFGGSLIGDYALDMQRPAFSLKEILLQPESEIGQFGRLQGLLAFIKNQLNLRLAIKR